MVTLPHRWVTGDYLYAEALDENFDALQQVMDNFTNRLNAIEASGGSGSGTNSTVQQMNISWPDGVSDIQTGEYILILSADYQMTLSSIFYTVGTNGGTFGIQFMNAGSEVGGLTFTADQQSTTEVVATSNNTINEGYELVLVISNIQGSPRDADIQVNINKSTTTTGGGSTESDFVDETGDIIVDEDGNSIVFGEVN